MTRLEFMELCMGYGIAPEIALENDALFAALTEKDYSEVKRILNDEF